MCTPYTRHSEHLLSTPGDVDVLHCVRWLTTLQANEHKRAEQLRGVIERLGPAYVKVAQAMSTRVDLLSPEYYMQIQLLQDRVPSFPCEQAKEVSDVLRR
eukprot:GHRQ01024177.1.p3 GENE.GHRQ01024177.1~~GHRQ01024177.1.p3  ORF type:complete len:100 (-),score=38.34 GHRQ01024177.1:879-1178(-)